MVQAGINGCSGKTFYPKILSTKAGRPSTSLTYPKVNFHEVRIKSIETATTTFKGANCFRISVIRSLNFTV